MLKKLNDEINKLNVSNKDYLITVLFSLLLSVLLVGPIVAILLNLLIYTYYIKFIIFLIVISIYFGVSLFLKFYLEGLSRGRINNINKYVIYISTLLMPVALLINLLIYLFV